MNFFDNLPSFRATSGLVCILALLPWHFTRAQAPEVFLNQGEIGANPILLEKQRILIDCADRISFWDIDRSMLLKSYGGGNQYTSGVTSRETPGTVSSQGKFFLTTTFDSVFVYDVSTQIRIKRLKKTPLTVPIRFYTGFTANEKYLVMLQNDVLNIWNTQTWDTVAISGIDQVNRGVVTINGDYVLAHAPFGSNGFTVINLHGRQDQVTVENRVFTPAVSMPYTFSGISVVPLNKDKIVVYGTQKNSTTVWVYNIPEGRVEKEIALAVEANQCFQDTKNGWLVFTPDGYAQEDGSHDFDIGVVNVSTGDHYVAGLSGLSRECYESLSYDDYHLREGTFIIRCYDARKSVGIRLASKNKFIVNQFLNFAWLHVSADAILFRTEEDRDKGQYQLVNTRRTLMKKKAAYIALHSLSICDRIGAIEKQSSTKYILGKWTNLFDFIPYKIIQTKSTPVSIFPVGKVGAEYVFRFGSGNMTLDSYQEFEDFDQVAALQASIEGNTKYFSHNMLTGENHFFKSTYGIENKLVSTEGYFHGRTKKGEYGFDVLDSVALIDRNTYDLIGFGTRPRLDSVFGQDLLSIPDLSSKIHFNKDRSEIVFLINNTLYCMKIVNKVFERPRKLDLSEAMGGYQIIQDIGFCNNDQDIFIVSATGRRLDILEHASLKVIYSLETPGKIIISSASAPAFLIENSDKAVELHNYRKKKIVSRYLWNNQKWFGNDVHCFFSNTGKIFVIHEWDGTVGIHKASNGRTIYKEDWGPGQYKVLGLVNDTLLYYLNGSGIPQTLDIHEDQRRAFQASVPDVNFVVDSDFFEGGDSLLITTGESNINVWDTRSRRLIRRIFLLDSSSAFVMNDSLYYTMNKGHFNSVLYRNGMTVSGIQQLDMRYNRPSVFILSKDSLQRSRKQALEGAYRKRLRRGGINTNADMGGLDLTCDILNKAMLSSFTKERRVEIRVALRAKEFPAASLHVLVNEVPVYGRSGIRLKTANALDTTLQVQLSSGANNIEIYATDPEGRSSNRFPLHIISSAAQERERLYFVGIGINRFLDSDYNLRWSVKDIRDLAEGLKKQHGEEIVIDTLFNRNVTYEKVKALKTRLRQSDVDDKVIVAYSGHGLLNKNYDYFLSAYDVNFTDPEQNGLPYELLEGLLDSIPARRKLLLIDACHSGEVDKEELRKIGQVQFELDSTKKGGVLVVEGNEKIGMKSSFELMQELFVDLSRSTGATVISAAAGTQFALERADLKNGVFSYSILEAMQTHATMPVSRLKGIVSSRVRELTKGLQKPTFRNETMDFDWEVW